MDNGGHMSSDETIKKAAIKYAKKHKKTIAKKICNTNLYPKEGNPVSVFMAGSPGAGKTEASKALIKELNVNVLRLDVDDLRSEIEGYNGINSSLYQAGACILLEKCHDIALSQKQSFILDGTMADYKKAQLNLTRSLNKGRSVQIFFVYQRPDLAWAFVCARQKIEGRHVPPDVFIEQYLSSRQTVDQLKSELPAIKID
ncbi:zeta toxin family protein, partial [Endozoicomonas sp.]|nr:zeta toxin family protein [Endozoicomonas sp.]